MTLSQVMYTWTRLKVSRVPRLRVQGGVEVCEQDTAVRKRRQKGSTHDAHTLSTENGFRTACLDEQRAHVIAKLKFAKRVDLHAFAWTMGLMSSEERVSHCWCCATVKQSVSRLLWTSKGQVTIQQASLLDFCVRWGT